MPSSTLVLSYNICYQAMCNDNNGTAAALGASCTWLDKARGVTICAVNMARMIEQAPASMGCSNFDFVGIQEASNCNALVIHAANSLGKLSMISSKAIGTANAKGAKMASFYDGNKYKLNEPACCSQFNSHSLARPFQILLLTEIATNDQIIFINVHTPHGSDMNTKTKVPYMLFDAVEYDLSEAVKNMKTFDPTINYRLFMTGDFNETGWNWGMHKLAPNKWTPLKTAGLATTVELSNFVLSCSKDDGCWHTADAQRGGDYVFCSGNPSSIQVPPNYNFAPAGACGDASIMKSYWQSDHLPVLALLS